MTFRKRAIRCALRGAALFGVCGGAALAADPAVQLELNRLEAVGPSVCRMYLVAKNTSGDAYRSLKLDLFTFGGDGVVLKRAAVDVGPLAARKTQVKMFDFAGAPCAGVSRVLLNDVVSCAHEAASSAEACLAAIETRSRVADAAFEK